METFPMSMLQSAELSLLTSLVTSVWSAVSVCASTIRIKTVAECPLDLIAVLQPLTPPPRQRARGQTMRKLAKYLRYTLPRDGVANQTFVKLKTTI